MPDIELKPSDIVAGLEPDEHVEIRRVAPFGSKTLIEGIAYQFDPLFAVNRDALSSDSTLCERA